MEFNHEELSLIYSVLTKHKNMLEKKRMQLYGIGDSIDSIGKLLTKIAERDEEDRTDLDFK